VLYTHAMSIMSMAVICVTEDLYWIYDSRQPPRVNGSRPMTEWGNIAGDLDDVMYIRSGYIYFFIKGCYYRFNCKTKLVSLVGCK
jgi:hypothetical protein